jgi:hypothetical protein
MNPPLHLEFAMPDPGESPLNLIQLFQLANTLIGGEIVGSYTPYVLQNGTPNVDDRDKIWFELDDQGKPVAIKKFYNGTWRRIYNGMRGEIRGYTGKPTDDFDMSQPNPGRGKIDGIYDGWALCNGKNGTPDLSNNFLIGAHMNDTGGHTGYHSDKGGWTTFVDGKDDLHTGGASKTMIQMKNLPPLDNSAPDPLTGLPPTNGPGLYLHGNEAKPDSDQHDSTRPLVDKHYANALPRDVFIIKYGADPNGSPAVPQEEFPSLPPFIALGWITFIGYT